MDAILAHNETPPKVPNLLVGNDTRDDAAVMELDDGTAIVSTTDFFMPVVDDAHDFGRIASVNSISDVYAMGAQPLLAIAILGWPVKDLPPELAHDVIEGARLACKEAGIPLAGGHSIDNPEPIFGLAVTGRLPVAHLKRNSGARAGDLIYLTKPLGLGVLTTALKQCKLRPEHADLARDAMIKLNVIGAALGPHQWVTALTDITGFGLLGHLGEVCEASQVSAELEYDRIPLLDPAAIDEYVKAGCVPGGTIRNWQSFGKHIAPLDEHRRKILCDPQTSGGLLVAVDPAHDQDFRSVAEQHDMQLEPIGKFEELAEYRIRVV